MPEAHIELDYATPLQLVIAVILAAQCTDKRVNLVSPALFRRYPDAASLAAADSAELERLIHSCGFFRAKARSLKGMAAALVERHGGEVPTARAELAALPGVGPKTAGVVTIHVGGDPAFPVDTHVKRLVAAAGLHPGARPGPHRGRPPGPGPRGTLGAGSPAPRVARAADVLRPLSGLRPLRGARRSVPRIGVPKAKPKRTARRERRRPRRPVRSGGADRRRRCRSVDQAEPELLRHPDGP